MRYLLILFIVTSSLPLLSQKKGIERKIVNAVEKHEQEAVELLKTSVNINSGTMNFDGVREVGRLFMKEFEELGFTTSWEDGAAFDRAGHLIASREGKAGATKMLLIGHLDTVFDRFSVSGHILVGGFTQYRLSGR